MTFCKKCGNELKSSDRFCANCGEKVQRIETITVTDLDSEEIQFHLRDHLEEFRETGFLISKNDKEQVKNWNPKEYLKEIFQSIIHGGFSYFRYRGKASETEFAEGVLIKTKHKEMVREKEPLLLKDERLEKIADIKGEGNPRLNEGERWGPLYYTGRRFILDTVEFQVQAFRSQKVEHSLPLSSYWIKPDFTELFNATNTDAFYEEGTLRKKRYNNLSFKVVEIKKPKMISKEAVKCGYLLRGPDDEKIYDHYHYWSNTNNDSIDELANKLEDLISKAEVTKISDLIKHTYDCQRMGDVMIETSLNYGPRKLSEKPYTFVGYWNRFA